MSVVGYVCHHGVENARLSRMLAQIIETTHVPSCIMRDAAFHRCVQHSPGLPRTMSCPKTSSEMHAVWNIGLKRPGARRMRDKPILFNSEHFESGQRANYAKEGFR